MAKNQANKIPNTEGKKIGPPGTVDFKGEKLKSRWHAAQENSI
jgi:hypothetical protein